MKNAFGAGLPFLAFLLLQTCGLSLASDTALAEDPSPPVHAEPSAPAEPSSATPLLTDGAASPPAHEASQPPAGAPAFASPEAAASPGAVPAPPAKGIPVGDRPLPGGVQSAAALRADTTGPGGLTAARALGPILQALEAYPPVAVAVRPSAVRPRRLPGTRPATSNRPAQGEQLRAPLRITIPEGTLQDILRTRGYPTSTISTPTAFGPRWGQVYAGASYQNRIRYDDWRDGILTFGGGLGDPSTYVGLDVTVNILDTYDDFAQDRSLSLKLHRRLPLRSALAVGYENIWHTAGTDGGSSRYVVGSTVIKLRERLGVPLGSVVVSLGVGTDRFLSEERFARGENGVNLFGSAAVRVLRPVNAVANWTGQDLNLGLSIAPVRRWPVVITPALVDVTGAAGDGARFSVSAGIGHTLHR